MTTENPRTLRLDQIRIDGGTQPRVEIDQAVVDDYAALYEGGTHLPPVIVFYDGATFWLADGFHRFWATQKARRDAILAEVHQGTKRDAQWYSFGANANHGLRRTQADVAHILKTMLLDEEWAGKSDGEIAKHTGIPRRTVYDHRQRILGESAKYDSGPRSFIHPKTGKPATMNTANIGRKPKTPRRRFEPKPGISPHAMKPIRGHSTHQPKTALELPHDPHWACRAILSAMGHDFARALIKELTTYLEGASE
jgi:hypothetical protein